MRILLTIKYTPNSVPSLINRYAMSLKLLYDIVLCNDKVR